MNTTTFMILNILNIALLNIILNCDNISVIALITQKLPVEFAKKANMIGISTAVVLTIFFASIISLIMEVQWLPIQLIGGFILIKITIDLLKSDQNHYDSRFCHKQDKKYMKFWLSVVYIIMADIALSLDNVIAIAGAADGNSFVIACGLLISLPFILFGSQYIIRLMHKNRIVLYISGAVLIYTALEMIFSYKYISPFIPQIISATVPLLISVLIIVYGIYVIKKIPPNVSSLSESEE